MSKRFYIILFCTLSLSVVLLGFSFARESGNNDLLGLSNGESEEYRVVYSNNQRLNTKDNNSFDISLINKMNENSKFYLVLEEVNKSLYKNVYYTIDDGEKKELLNNEIYLGELMPFGTEGDYLKHSIKIISELNEELEFKLNVKKYNEKTFVTILKENEKVYVDSENNYRFYGENVNNYIKNKDDVCRIIGLINDKLKIICEPKVLGIYDTTLGNYATIDDVLLSYNDSDVTINNLTEYKSWIIEDEDYWLEDSYNITYYVSSIDGIKSSAKNVNLYIRYVYELDSSMILIGGDGIKNNPYEVSYGS